MVLKENFSIGLFKATIWLPNLNNPILFLLIYGDSVIAFTKHIYSLDQHLAKDIKIYLFFKLSI